MKATKQIRREAKELFRGCLVNGLLDDARARQLVQRVLQAKPRGYLAVLEQFKRLIKLDLERRTARIESATALPQDLQAAVNTALARTYGPGLNISFRQNPALLGGMRIQVGSDVYDGSVRARLTALEQSF